MNATQCCSKLNKWVPIELGIHGVLTVLQLVTFHWYLFLLNLPLFAWEAYRFFSKPSGYIGVYDPAEIHNRNQLKGYMQEAMVKLGYHLIFFFVYLYSTIIRLVDD
ncbi:cornichon-like protein 4 [Lamellibrachia satsuma]|nr:cornichon-like protein 4 [Lamellibrachia satsuma]